MLRGPASPLLQQIHYRDQIQSNKHRRKHLIFFLSLALILGLRENEIRELGTRKERRRRERSHADCLNIKGNKKLSTGCDVCKLKLNSCLSGLVESCPAASICFTLYRPFFKMERRLTQVVGAVGVWSKLI